MFLDKPQITFLTANQTVNDGTDVSFFCRADAVPAPTAYNWFKNGVTIPSGSSGNLVNSGQELTVTNVQKGSAGRYSCSSTNVVGTGEERSTFLSVNCELYLNNKFTNKRGCLIFFSLQPLLSELVFLPFDSNYM